jgi:glycosyltransferase involved in cell wall biosynthesis
MERNLPNNYRGGSMLEQTNKKPLVSCIIIFFNAGEKFFIEAIDSIFAQTYDNWELFLADDGSTDESTSIALKYAQKYPGKVHYLEHKQHQNRGMSATRNLGIRHAKGEYIAFLDADDVWLPHKLEQQINIIENYPEAAMLYGRTQFWFSWSTDNPCRSIFSLAENDADPMTITSIKFDQIIAPPTQLIVYLQDRDIYPCSCSMIVRSSTFKDIGGFEEDFRNANEDMVFHSKVFLKYPVYVSSQCWDRYRMHPDSYWRTAWREGKGREAEQVGRFKYLTWLEKYLVEQDIKNPLVWKKLNQAFFPYRHPRLFQLLKNIQYPYVLSREIYRKLKKLINSALVKVP